MANLVNCKYRNEDNINDNNTKICGIDIGLTVKSVPIHVKLPIENLTNGDKGEGFPSLCVSYSLLMSLVRW